jgi:hyperosmotically inducible periplasmic protein
MNTKRYRNTLIAASIAAVLSIGAAGCGQQEPAQTTAPARDARTDEQRTPQQPEQRTAMDRPADQRADERTTMDRGQDMARQAEEGMSDTWITTQVQSQLLADDTARGFDVDVETQQGVVILSGQVDDQAAVDHIRSIAEDVEGVRSVDASGLTVGAQPQR